MPTGFSNLPDGLVLRPANPTDQAFIESLYASTRDDLRLIDGEREFVESIIDMQYRAQTQGYGDQHPNALYFVAEKQGERIGRVTLDFTADRVHIIDIAFVPAVRGKGYGTTVLQAVQQAAATIKAPVSLSVASANLMAKQLYARLGFRIEESSEMYERMIWYPDADAMRAR